MNTGLNLLGNPYSLSNIGQKTDVEETTAYAGTLAFDGKIYLNVVNDGYKPNLLRAPSNQPVSLNLITNETYSCSRAFVIPELKISKILPATGTVEVVIPPQSTGKMLTFTCSMGMYTGQIVFEG